MKPEPIIYLDLEKEGFEIGQIVVLKKQYHNPKRIIYSKRLGRYALQNKGEHNSGKDDAFLDTPEDIAGKFWGSLGDCFLLSPGNKGQLEVIGFQPVLPWQDALGVSSIYLPKER